jgi:hypothetical protein
VTSVRYICLGESSGCLHIDRLLEPPRVIRQEVGKQLEGVSIMHPGIDLRRGAKPGQRQRGNWVGVV